MKRNLLLSPDGGEGAAGTGTVLEAGAGEASGEELFEGAGAEGVGKDGGVEVGKEGGEGDAAPAAAAATTGLSKEDIASILKEAGLGGKAAPDTSVGRPLPTTEELEKLFNVWKPSNELIAQLRSEKPEDAVAALTAIRDGLLKQAMSMAEYRVQQLLKGLQDDQIAPLQSFVSEAQANSFRSDFFTKYPDLEKYETIVDAVAAKLQQSGFKAESREKVMERFATEAQAIVKSLLAGSGAAGAAAGNGKTGSGNPPQRKMSTLTGGGHGPGGTGVGNKGSQKGPAGIEVFDD